MRSTINAIQDWQLPRGVNEILRIIAEDKGVTISDARIWINEVRASARLVFLVNKREVSREVQYTELRFYSTAEITSLLRGMVEDATPRKPRPGASSRRHILRREPSRIKSEAKRERYTKERSEESFFESIRDVCTIKP